MSALTAAQRRTIRQAIDACPSTTIAADNQGTKAETASALYNLCSTTYVDNLVLEVQI